MPIAPHEQYHNLYLIEHPLLKHKLALLRDKRTPKSQFKELVHEITILMAYEVTQDLPTISKKIETPLETMYATVMDGKKQVIMPILRAGLGMVDGFLTLMPSARVAHIGLYRNEETLEPNCYYFKLPKGHQGRKFFVCDPMLATGGSALEAISRLKKEGVKQICFVCIVSAPEGIQRLLKVHPDVPIYAASLDRQLNDRGYILPGLGDAGDRLFGTK